ncbi:uncharacterized protein LOC111114696 [Crassostrea virginica]|uniref:Transmembrane protein 177-like n=1 Tax=Crassostrea virginica TaxID=6565 RepID=A0A8B8BZU9_CRAVI|nr:transmembrane protein 177-like [Crassostrea virginica]
MNRLQKFVTNHNKRIVGSLLAAGSIAELFGFFAPETVFIQDYKNLLTFKEMEEPYPLSPKIIQAKNEAFQDLISKGRLTQSQLEKIDIVINADYSDPFHKGNLHSKYGSFIGVPIAFVYNSPEDVPMDNYRIGQTITIEDGTLEGATLKKSIILGKNAVKYALLRECLLTDTYDMQVKQGLMTLFVGGSSMILYTGATRVKRPVEMLLRAVPVVAVYGLLILQVWCRYKRQKDFLVDQEIPAFGEDYVKGAEEFYSQAVRRNKALYYIMKDLTKDNFTPQGNEKVNIFWNDRIRVSDKKDFYRHKLEELNKENSQESC